MLLFTLLLRILMNMVFLGGPLFLAAGTLAWWRAWVFLGVYFLGAVAMVVSLSSHKDLLNERLKPPVQHGQPLGDKLVVLLLVVAGLRLIFLSLKENAFAVPVVKDQAERHQTAIDTGVYGMVRHPLYAGLVLLLVGLPLWLESYAAAVCASVPSGLLALRSVGEEQFLRRELQGYDAYTKRVPYRLIPFFW